jgi:hypothetical protein
MAALISASKRVDPAFGTRLAGFNGAERRDWLARERLVRRVQGEFEEMPGLRLTFGQARLLFGLEQACCRRILTGLTQAGFLMRTDSGLYGRRDFLA